MTSQKVRSRGGETGACLALSLLLWTAASPSKADQAEQLNPALRTGAPSIKTHDSGPEALQIMKARGFIGEMFYVPSRDGTLLSMYHIINPFADPRALNKFPVLMFHGVIGDAAQMLGHSERARARKPLIGQLTVDASDTCLALLLSNNNFDVWMVDARGTNLNNHKASYDIFPLEGQKFWNFTLDDQIQKDLPTAIDFVLAQTHESKLHYIGFSESTLFMFALLSYAPHYADKLASYVALAPVAYIEHISGTALSLFASTAAIPDWINGNFVPQQYTDTLAATLRMLCQNELITRTLCVTVTSSLGGIGPNELSHGFLGTTFKSTSIKAIKHFLQLFAQKRFGMYDHGTPGNLIAYGQATPPAYDLSRVRLPFIILFRGDRDLLSDPLDQDRLLKELGTKPYLDYHFPNYNHLDFLMSETIIQDVNFPAVRALFDLTRLQAAPTGSLVKSPATLALPRPYKPILTSVPDGNRRVEIKSDLVHNLINGVVETVESHMEPNSKGASALPIAAKVMQQPLNMLRSFGDRVDALESKLTHVADLIGVGSIAAP